MKADDLRDRLARLRSGETLLLPAAEVEQVFACCPSLEERRAATTKLAALYHCRLTVCGPGESQILFTRNNTYSSRNPQNTQHGSGRQVAGEP
jgi:hypothetical protein